MTLRRKQFVHPNYEGKTIKVGLEGGEAVTIKPIRPTVIIEQVGNWYDAEAIHLWFVRNVMHGKNEPNEVIVTRQQLCKLLEDAREVVKRSTLISKPSFLRRTLGKLGATDEKTSDQVIVDTSTARKLLPVSGKSNRHTYDEQYLYDLHETISILIEALEGYPDALFSYSASW